MRKPYVIEKSHIPGMFRICKPGKRGSREGVGIVWSVPVAQREKRGRWEVLKDGQVVGSGSLREEAADLLWNMRDREAP